MLSNIQPLLELGKRFYEISDTRNLIKLPLIDFYITTSQSLTTPELTHFLSQFDSHQVVNPAQYLVQRHNYKFDIFFKVDGTQQVELKWTTKLKNAEEEFHVPTTSTTAAPIVETTTKDETTSTTTEAETTTTEAPEISQTTTLAPETTTTTEAPAEETTTTTTEAPVEAETTTTTTKAPKKSKAEVAAEAETTTTTEAPAAE